MLHLFCNKEGKIKLLSWIHPLPLQISRSFRRPSFNIFEKYLRSISSTSIHNFKRSYDFLQLLASSFKTFSLGIARIS